MASRYVLAIERIERLEWGFFNHSVYKYKDPVLFPKTS
jgi:hypothetical protein